MPARRARGCNGGNGSIAFWQSVGKKVRCHRKLRFWQKPVCRPDLQRTGEKVMNCATNSPIEVGRPAIRKTGKRSRGALEVKHVCAGRILKSRTYGASKIV